MKGFGGDIDSHRGDDRCARYNYESFEEKSQQGWVMLSRAKLMGFVSYEVTLLQFCGALRGRVKPCEMKRKESKSLMGRIVEIGMRSLFSVRL